MPVSLFLERRSRQTVCSFVNARRATSVEGRGTRDNAWREAGTSSRFPIVHNSRARANFSRLAPFTRGRSRVVRPPVVRCARLCPFAGIFIQMLRRLGMAISLARSTRHATVQRSTEQRAATTFLHEEERKKKSKERCSYRVRSYTPVYSMFRRRA